STSRSAGGCMRTPSRRRARCSSTSNGRIRSARTTRSSRGTAGCSGRSTRTSKGTGTGGPRERGREGNPMRKLFDAARILVPLVWLGAAPFGAAPAQQHEHHDHGTASADRPDECAAAAHGGEVGASARRFMVLAAQRGVFYDGGGPSVVVLIEVDDPAGEMATGAVGLYADDAGTFRFGAVPPAVYDPLVAAPEDRDSVTLRLELSQVQYDDVLDVLATWDRRAREGALLYRGDALMNQILMLKQATEAAARCGRDIDLYTLDWGIEDRISEDHPWSQIPFLFFEELKERNESLHVPDERMPQTALSLLASSSAGE